jgi:hypothetical protein
MHCFVEDPKTVAPSLIGGFSSPQRLPTDEMKTRREPEEVRRPDLPIRHSPGKSVCRAICCGSDTGAVAQMTHPSSGPVGRPCQIGRNGKQMYIFLSRFVAVWRGLSRKTRGCIRLMAQLPGLVVRRPLSWGRGSLSIDFGFYVRSCCCPSLFPVTGRNPLSRESDTITAYFIQVYTCVKCCQYPFLENLTFPGLRKTPRSCCGQIGFVGRQVAFSITSSSRV